MSSHRSPRYEPLPQIPNTIQPTTKGNISPIASLVGENNMILIWTGLAILLFIAFIIFYLAFNPSKTEEHINENINKNTEDIDKTIKQTTLPL